MISQLPKRSHFETLWTLENLDENRPFISVVHLGHQRGEFAKWLLGPRGSHALRRARDTTIAICFLRRSTLSSRPWPPRTSGARDAGTRDVRWCILASMRAAHAEMILAGLIRRAIREVAGSAYRHIEQFNDDRATSHALVLQALHQARKHTRGGHGRGQPAA